MLILVAGPIASGKSTLARAVARLLEEQGRRAAAVDLDLLYELVDPSRGAKDDAGIWRTARRAAAAVADVLLGEGYAVVVEGDLLTGDERAELLEALRTRVDPVFVTLVAGIDAALVRVAADPTRGRSRDPVVLRGHYAAIASALAQRPAGDLVLDTEALDVGACAAAVVDRALRPAARP